MQLKNSLISKAGIILVLTTAIFKWLLVDLWDLRIAFIPLVITAWTLFIWKFAKTDRNFFKNAGLGLLGFKATALLCLVFIIVSASLMFGYVKLQHYNIANPNMFIAMLLYPIWGIVQQFIVMNFVLNDLQKFKLNKFLIILVSALAFGLIHLPDVKLFAATFVAGLVFSAIYIKHQNLWPLGITHGLLASMLYYWVLNQDPIQQIINTL